MTNTALCAHPTITEALERAATWGRATGSRYAVRAYHGYGLTAWWAVVAA